MSARLRLTLSVLSVATVLLVGTTGYMIIESDQDVPLRDALYMTVITLSTVGYGEPWELSSAARTWSIVVIVFGIATVSYAFGSLISLVVGGELRFVRERHKMEKAIERQSDHVILCGFGRMGAMVVEELRQQGIPITIIEEDEKQEHRLRDTELPFILGDASDEDLLIQAGLERARALIVGLPSDADNVYITMTAHTLNPDLMIIARAEQPSAEAKLIRAGASRVVCPQLTGAVKVVNILIRPTISDFVDLSNKGLDLELDEYVINGHSPLAGKSLRNADIRKNTGAMAVAIKKSNGVSIVDPDPDDTLSTGDTLILVGPKGVSDRLDQIDMRQ